MSTSSSSNLKHADRRGRIHRVLVDVTRRREMGDFVQDDAVFAAHPDLLPEIREELAKLRKIWSALETADLAGSQRALERLEADWERDRADASTSSRLRLFDEAQLRGSTPPPVDGSSDSAPAGTGETWRINRYRVKRLLGQGGFGQVYLASDEALGRDVAIKIPHRKRISAPDALDDFMTEARVIARLDHPNIVPVYDVGRTAAGEGYVVSKLIPGATLAEWIAKSRPSFSDAVGITAAIADALDYAHRLGLVHRDVKPGNILLNASRVPYLADFGLALKDDDQPEFSVVAGTPAYMSPEQARGESHRVDGRSDIFGLGVVLYELLTGCRPFTATGRDALVDEICRREVTPPHDVDRLVPTELSRICLKALAKRAIDRYQTSREFAEDLRGWLRGRFEPDATPQSGSARGAVEAGSRVLPGDVNDASASTGVVPKGLRAFDANDADFFLDLLPGPRDRFGWPESIRQWRNRIEETDGDETFPVGLLYGPSGCGKSSFVRAGLLPRLSAHVHPIYLDASADETEEHLRRQLDKHVGGLPANAGLAACCAAIRRGHRVPARHKVLIVIDQFEQWLHGKDERRRLELAQSLRQCDGGRLQCLLLVRDDFWLALSRFLSDLEVDLAQGKNTALVDLFDPLHARRVLLEFGRAFGRLPRNTAHLTAGQNAFLDQAIEALADDGRVIPVRLALFAEMIKWRDWIPETLRAVGGARGVGVTFLQETFSARTANPQHRLHEKAARAVLAALMPAEGSPIKGHTRSYPELLDLSGYGGNPAAFKELMRILDSETRLLTPTETIDEESDPSRANPGRRDYQLTHDYLVPSLREWLTERQKSTRRGRIELALGERASMWNARRERRQLPSLWEWLAMRAATRRSEWSAPQRRMMRAAARHHGMVVGTALTAVLVGLLASAQITNVANRAMSHFQAATASVWMALGQHEAIWSLARHDPDPTLRTGVIHRLTPLAVNVEDVVEQIAGEPDVSVRRAMLLVTGTLAGSDEQRLNANRPRLDPSPEMVGELVRIYRDAPDPGVHSAAEWALRRFERQADVNKVQNELRTGAIQAGRQWYMTRAGHTMLVIPGPTQFMMGTKPGSGAATDDEAWHPQSIPRSFSISSQETTVAQFVRFLLQDQQRFDQRAAAQGLAASAPHPATWYEAVAYCNWLSRQENIPRSQWCYLPNADGDYAEGMSLAPNMNELRGYRLPTEAEWEYACRANSTTVRHLGKDVTFLPEYAVFAGNASHVPDLCGSRKPNDFGLFDTYGNVAEWCQDPYRRSNVEPGAPISLIVRDDLPRVHRGGSFQDGAHRLRSAARDRAVPTRDGRFIGFRVARSYP